MTNTIRSLTDYSDGFDLRRVVGWDTETHLISPENGLAPPVVCLTMSGTSATRMVAEELASELPDTYLDDGEHDDTWVMLVGAGDGAHAFQRMMIHADVLVAHNLPFDLGVARRAGWVHDRQIETYLDEGVFRDTKVREQLIAIATGRYNWDDRINKKTSFSLARLAEVYLGKDRYVEKKDPKAWRLRYHELDGVPVARWPRKAVDYAIEDAEDALAVFVSQARTLALPEGVVVNSDGNVTNERAQTKAAWVLHTMSMNGPKATRAEVEAFKKEVTAQAESANDAARRGGFLRVNKCKLCEGTGWLGSPPRLRECYECHGDPAYLPPRARVPKKKATLHKSRLQAWVRASLGDYTPMTEPTDKYPQGQVKTGADVLRMTNVSVLHEYAEGLEAKKDLTTYVPILEESIRHPVMPSFNVLVRSGRTSGYNPNLQNPTGRPGFRECFAPSPGNVFCSTDYSTVELVTLAQTCLEWFGHSRMADAINAGRDLHLDFGAQMLGISYEEAAERRRAGDPEVKEARTNAKVANFGFPGGLGVKTLVEYAKGFGVELDFNRASELKESWLEAWPEMGEYFGYISDLADRGLPDDNGRERFTIAQAGTGRIRGGVHYTSACNTFFQGRAADLAKHAMWALWRACYIDTSSPLYGVRMWAFIHDEVLFEGPEVTAHLWAPETRRIMVEAGQPFVPDVKLSAEEALMRRWSKKAEPAYRIHPLFGRILVPYEDTKE